MVHNKLSILTVTEMVAINMYNTRDAQDLVMSTFSTLT